jgi:ABC-type sugar transport system ATPase subunit
VADGEFVVLVGPSGCGKSTLLRLIAGLDTADEGRIRIDDVDVTQVPPQSRDVAMVFQSYALYPHMTVRDNLAYPLKVRRQDRAAIESRVREVAAVLGLEALLDRRPAQLSGGQRQRVALGRTMVRTPQAFLLDEPLSNLDPALRAQARAELRRLHRRLGATIVHVTHDQEEAMTLGDRIVVMRDGAVEQVGTPGEVYGRPANTFVAQFIGAPPMNLLPIEGLVGIRPHDVLIGSSGDREAAVELVERRGADAVVHLRLVEPAAELIAVVTGEPPREGERVFVIFPPDRLHRFDARGVLKK